MIPKIISFSNILILSVIWLLAFMLGFVSLASDDQLLEWKSHGINFAYRTLAITLIGMVPVLVLIVVNLVYQLVKLKKINRQEIAYLFILGVLGLLFVSIVSTCIFWFN